MAENATGVFAGEQKRSARCADDGSVIFSLWAMEFAIPPRRKMRLAANNSYRNNGSEP